MLSIRADEYLLCCRFFDEINPLNIIWYIYSVMLKNYPLMYLDHHSVEYWLLLLLWFENRIANKENNNGHEWMVHISIILRCLLTYDFVDSLEIKWFDGNFHPHHAKIYVNIKHELNFIETRTHTHTHQPILSTDERDFHFIRPKNFQCSTNCYQFGLLVGQSNFDDIVILFVARMLRSQNTSINYN